MGFGTNETWRLNIRFQKITLLLRSENEMLRRAGSGSRSWNLFPKYSLKFYFIIQSFIGYHYILRVWELLRSRYIFLHKIGNVTKPFCLLHFVCVASLKTATSRLRKEPRVNVSDVLQLWDPVIRFFTTTVGKDLLVESWITRRRVMGFSNSSYPRWT